MITLSDIQTEVPTIDETLVEVNPGDVWPLPYRGSRYTLKKYGDRLRMCWTRTDIVYCSDSMPLGLIKAMIEFKGDSRGSFRITPHREVITKVERNSSLWEPVYIGKLEGFYSFPGFDLDPKDLQTGNFWRGLHFKHGEEFAVWNREGNDNYLYWTMRGLYFRSIEKYPELCSKVREIRPQCGRIYFTEFGHIWMNLPLNEVSLEWDSKIKNLIQEDKYMLATTKNDILLRSIVERLQATNTYPIYLGKISDFDSGVPPRTHFSSAIKFGIGGDDIDDEDVYDAESWKKMQRDY